MQKKLTFFLQDEYLNKYMCGAIHFATIGLRRQQMNITVTETEICKIVKNASRMRTLC
jgi:hypothetical protein